YPWYSCALRLECGERIVHIVEQTSSANAADEADEVDHEIFGEPARADLARTRKQGELRAAPAGKLLEEPDHPGTDIDAVERDLPGRRDAERDQAVRGREWLIALRREEVDQVGPRREIEPGAHDP